MKPALLFLSVAMFVAPSAFATLTLDPAGPYRAGDRVHVRWNGLPEDVEELEFLLVRGEGAEEIVRITPQLDPRRGEFVWRAPAFAADDAFLRLRAGMDEKEIEIAESARFAIVTPDESGALDFRDGEWWEAPPAGAWTTPPDPAITTSQGRARRRFAVHASRVRGRVSTLLVVAQTSAPLTVATSVKERPVSAAPLTIPQRK